MRRIFQLTRCLTPAMRMHSTGNRLELFVRFLTSHSQNISRLPVPPLKQTLNRYLISAKPLLSADLYERACQLVETFGRPDGYGEQLQSLLENRAKTTVNWLEEWWLNYAYLDYRLPVPVHVNPGILTPQLSFRGTDKQLRYAANLISHVLEYKKMTDEGSIPTEYMGNSELCMSQYYRVLGGCRVPGASRDFVKHHPGGKPDSPRHIIVIRNNHMFAMNVYDINGHPLTSYQLYRQLLNIFDQSQHAGIPVGILTTQHRDIWFNIFTQLSQDATNCHHLMDIEQSIFVLALDKSVSVQTNSCQETLYLNQMNHGGGSQVNSGNRWFDKTLQVIVSPDGAIGFNYEHSAAEGPPVVHLIDHCCSKLDDNLTEGSIHESSLLPRPLYFNISDSTKQAIDVAAKSFDILIDDLDLIYYSFDKFGKKFTKSHRLSPDAFIQVSFQLAYYRLHGHCVPTYESGSLRKFQHGRTDTIRSCSLASLDYCKAMTSSDQPLSYKAACFRAAVEAHQSYTQQVVNGNGMDRHLLGLKFIAAENGLPVPELLVHAAFEKTCYWKMSTSQVASRTGGLLCFGPVVPDGYGICYNPMESKFLFAISCWRSCQHTDTTLFAKSLEQSLCDAQYVLTNFNSLSKL